MQQFGQWFLAHAVGIETNAAVWTMVSMPTVLVCACKKTRATRKHHTRKTCEREADTHSSSVSSSLKIGCKVAGYKVVVYTVAGYRVTGYAVAGYKAAAYKVADYTAVGDNAPSLSVSSSLKIFPPRIQTYLKHGQAKAGYKAAGCKLAGNTGGPRQAPKLVSTPRHASKKENIIIYYHMNMLEPGIARPNSFVHHDMPPKSEYSLQPKSSNVKVQSSSQATRLVSRLNTLQFN